MLWKHEYRRITFRAHVFPSFFWSLMYFIHRIPFLISIPFSLTKHIWELQSSGGYERMKRMSSC